MFLSLFTLELMGIRDRAERDFSQRSGRETFCGGAGPLQALSPLHPFTLYLEIGPQFSSLLLETPSSTPLPHPGSEVEPETVFQAISTSHLSVRSEGFRVIHRTTRSSAQRCSFSPDDPGAWVQVPELLKPPVSRAL